MHRSPPNRGNAERAGKSLFAGECVVADAVYVERVSVLKFPINGKLNGKFSKTYPIPNFSLTVEQ